MRFDPFPEALEEALDEALKAPLRSLLEENDDLDPAGKCTRHENCRVVILALPDGYSTTLPLESFCQTGKEIWHHQLKLNGEACLYARSLVSQTEQGPTLRLIELVRSSLAARFDATLDTLEGLSEPPEAAWVIRLLAVPRYNEEYFAVFQGEKIQEIVPVRRSETKSPADGFVAAAEVYKPGSLLESFKGKTEFLGLRSPKSTPNA